MWTRKLTLKTKDCIQTSSRPEDFLLTCPSLLISFLFILFCLSTSLSLAFSLFVTHSTSFSSFFFLSSSLYSVLFYLHSSLPSVCPLLLSAFSLLFSKPLFHYLPISSLLSSNLVFLLNLFNRLTTSSSLFFFLFTPLSFLLLSDEILVSSSCL
ncbi:unnamed protein product [Acanthosepion pharaonis]|uniref:Uncharacterized protein n=1 Tax=Acanthosepion pharaonis TaxID=158019 RepID=A0A812BHC4_ACAPH|nr:unnamed protein product [Sepia pharaonis]